MSITAIRLLVISSIFLFALFSCSSENSGGIQPPEVQLSSPSQYSSSAALPQDYSRARAMNQKLGRGVNLGNAFDAACRAPNIQGCNYPAYPYATAFTNEPDKEKGGWSSCWSNPIKDDYFEIIKKGGFNSIRLPVRWAEKASDVSPFAIPASFTASVKDVVDKAIAAGFPVILNIHHFNELYDDCKSRDDNELQKDKLVWLWKQIAEEFKNYSDDYLIFEILNEPRARIDENVLNQLLVNVWPVIRETNPGRTIMINSASWGSYYFLPYINIPNNDPNVILSGHYYNPHAFTHQGDNNNPQYPAGEKWGAAYEQATLKKNIEDTYQKIKEKWPGTDGGTIPINIGEFGVSNKANMDDRVAWIVLLCKEMEAHNMSWHYWAFPSAGLFDSYDKTTDEWIPEILEALIPTE